MRVDELGAESSEKKLRREARMFPLGFARLLGDVARFLFAGQLVGAVRHFRLA